MALREDLDFEINFFENLLKESPDFTEVLTALGDAYTKKGRYQDGLEIDKRLAMLKPNEPIVHYNLACSYSLLRMADVCIKALEQALQLGYCDLAFMQQDPDLKFIRQDQRFNNLLFKYSK